MTTVHTILTLRQKALEGNEAADEDPRKLAYRAPSHHRCKPSLLEYREHLFILHLETPSFPVQHGDLNAKDTHHLCVSLSLSSLFVVSAVKSRIMLEDMLRGEQLKHCTLRFHRHIPGCPASLSHLKISVSWCWVPGVWVPPLGSTLSLSPFPELPLNLSQ